jgi:CHAT domain-containing protein
MVSRIYETYIDVIMRLHERDGSAGFDSEALAASESSRAMALLRVLNESGANLRRDISPELAERDRALGVRLSAKLEQQMRLVPGSESERRAAELAAEIVELKGERDRLDAEMRTSNPEFASILLPRALGAAALRERLLDDRTLLIEFAVGTDRGYAWALSREGLRSYSLPERDRLDRLSRAAYESLRRRPRTASARPVRETRELRELSDLLLKPVASELRAHSRLLVVADGPLEYLPLGLLPAPWTGRRQRLFRTHEVISIPSGTTAAHLRNEGRRSKSGPGLIAVLADPVFEPDDARVGGHPNGSVPGDPESALSRSAAFVGLGSGEKVRIPRLPFSRYEAQEISRLTTPAARLVRLDFNATRESAMDPRLGGFRIVHFATHGFLNSEHPELSGLVLSLVDKSGHSIPGYVSVSDTFSLRLPVDLVVLSGCQTALGKEIRGEGLVGLSRGFMYAGARAVMASLWKIDDQASAEFMKRFYRFLLSDAAGSPAAALRATQIDLAASKKWSDPFYWGGFVIQGEGALGRPERSKDSRTEPTVLPSRPAP